MSGDDEDFEDADALKRWLTTRGVNENKAAAAAPKLFQKKFDSPSTLIGISSDVLRSNGLPDPLAQTLSNKLKEQPQPKDGRPPLSPDYVKALTFSINELTAQVSPRKEAWASYSSGTRATLVENNVAESTDFSPLLGKAPVLNAADAEELEGIKGGEKCIVAFLLPRIEACFDNQYVVVDSQDHPWLAQFPDQPRADRLKPDAFLTHNALYEQRDPNVKQVTEMMTRAKRNGVPADDRLSAEMYILEGKKGLTKAGQLELVDYMNLSSVISSKGILVGREGFWLIKSCRLVIQSRTKVKWTDSGSMDLLKNFFAPSVLGKAINSMCEGLSCAVDTTFSNTCFLGAGAHGYAFRVTKDGDKVLKLSVRSESTLLTKMEWETLKKMKEDDDTLPVVSVENIHSDEEGCCGYLMTPVGRSVPELFSKTSFESLVPRFFTLLNKLHRAGYAHGDPRLQNIILCGGSLMWIDLMAIRSGLACTQSAKQLDMEVLTCSLFSLANMDVDEKLSGETFRSIRQTIAGDASIDYASLVCDTAIAVLKTHDSW